MSGQQDAAHRSSRFTRQWQHRPSTPIRVSPFFSWPPARKRMWPWIRRRWFAVAENLIVLVIALLSLQYLPSQLQLRDLSFDWIAELYLRNFLLMVLVAGGLHLYFYTFKRQQNHLQYDTRPLVRGSRLFKFSRQLWDNIFWTLASGVAVWTGYEVLMLWAMANGYIPMLQWQGNALWFVALLLLTPVWISLHFYCVHRWMHRPNVYAVVHAVHHRNNNVGPWSGLSMHPLEHLLFFSSVLLHWLVAAHPLHILFHLQHQALTAATSHTGFEALLVRDKKRLALGTFHHQMHHRYLDCNYGNLEMPCDKWFGSFHDGSEESHQKLLQRRRLRNLKSSPQAK